MTVNELIKLLENCPQDWQVMVPSYHRSHTMVPLLEPSTSERRQILFLEPDDMVST